MQNSKNTDILDNCLKVRVYWGRRSKGGEKKNKQTNFVYIRREFQILATLG